MGSVASALASALASASIVVADGLWEGDELGVAVALGLALGVPEAALAGLKTRTEARESRETKSAAAGTLPVPTTCPPAMLVSIETMSPVAPTASTSAGDPA